MFYGGRRIRMRSQNINKQKDAKNEAEYGESSATHKVPNYVNIFQCGSNILTFQSTSNNSEDYHSEKKAPEEIQKAIKW